MGKGIRGIVTLMQLVLFADALVQHAAIAATKTGNMAFLSTEKRAGDAASAVLAPTAEKHENVGTGSFMRYARQTLDGAFGRKLTTRVRDMLHLQAQLPEGSPEEADEAYEEVYEETSIAQRAGNAAVYVVIVFIVGLIYVKTKVSVEDGTATPEDCTHKDMDKEWRFGLFDCFSNLKICCLGFCCPSIRWSDTMRMAGFFSFWTALLIFAVLKSLDLVLGLVGSLLLVGVATYNRQKIRAKFGIGSPCGDAGTCGSIVLDACEWTFCCCCAIVQEARQMEEAWTINHKEIADTKAADAAHRKENPGIFSY